MATSHEILQDLKRVAVLLGHTPTRREYREHGAIADTQLERLFGGFSPALQACGLEPNRPGNKTKPDKFKYQSKKLESFTVHEVDLKELFQRAGNPETLKIIAQPDTHVQYADHDALSVFLQFIEWYRPHGHIIMGDFLDAEGISHWPSDSLSPRRFIPEVIQGRELLKKIVQATPLATFRAFIKGNHSDWIDQAMANKMPEFFDGLEQLDLKPDLKALLDLDHFGYELIPLNDFLKIGKAHFTHGLYTGDNHPKKHLETVKANIYYGHLHDTKSYTSVSMDGPIEAASLGCLCRLDAKFLKGKPNHWQHAFGIFEFFPDGSYSFLCPKIIRGRLSFMGKVFIA